VLRPGERIQLGEAVTFAYQVSQFDLNATVVTPSGGVDTVSGAKPAMPPAPAPAPQPVRQPAQPAYSGQVPAGPPPAAAGAPEQEKGGRMWLWAGLGCVGVFICLVAVGAVAFDMMNMYCTPPFDSLFSFLYTCP